MTLVRFMLKFTIDVSGSMRRLCAHRFGPSVAEMSASVSRRELEYDIRFIAANVCLRQRSVLRIIRYSANEVFRLVPFRNSIGPVVSEASSLMRRSP